MLVYSAALLLAGPLKGALCASTMAVKRRGDARQDVHALQVHQRHPQARREEHLRKDINPLLGV